MSPVKLGDATRFGWGATVTLTVIALAVLFFEGHLRGICSFTYDFVNGYHPVNSYIVEHLRHGIWPEWVAHQSLGYPLYMHVQSDLFYPVLWIFALFDSPYTLWSANILQVVHICFGAAGAYFLARANGIGRHASLFAAVAYFTMGGFFDGAQHVDIVRGYAYTPWCLFSLQLNRTFGWSGVALRAAIFSGFFLSAYPGQILAAAFIFPAYLLGQLFFVNQPERKGSVKNTLLICAAILLATGLAVPKYLPFALQFSSEASRAENFASIGRANLEFPHLFSFAIDSSHGNWPNDITLRSHYIGISVLALTLLAGLRQLYSSRLFLVIFAIAMTLSANLPSIILGSSAKIFSLSRVNIADYKSFITLSLIMVAAIILDSVARMECKPTRDRLYLVFIGLAAYLIVGSWLVKIQPNVDMLVSFIVLSLSLVLVYKINSISLTATIRREHLLYMLIIVSVINAWTVHRMSLVWADRDVMGVAKYYLKFDVFKEPPPSAPLFIEARQRPARIDLGHMHNYTHRGFYTGEYVLKGYDASKNLKKHDFIWSNNNYYEIKEKTPLIEFFRQPSCVLRLPASATPSDVANLFQTVRIEDIAERCNNSKEVQPLSYGSNQLIYDVRLDNDTLVIENEITWKGWESLIEYPTGEKRTLQLQSGFSPYRAWILPQGHYKWVVTFKNQYLNVSLLLAAIISLAGLLSTVFILQICKKQ